MYLPKVITTDKNCILTSCHLPFSCYLSLSSFILSLSLPSLLFPASHSYWEKKKKNLFIPHVIRTDKFSASVPSKSLGLTESLCCIVSWWKFSGSSVQLTIQSPKALQAALSLKKHLKSLDAKAFSWSPECQRVPFNISGGPTNMSPRAFYIKCSEPVCTAELWSNVFDILLV